MLKILKKKNIFLEFVDKMSNPSNKTP